MKRLHVCLFAALLIGVMLLGLWEVSPKGWHPTEAAAQASSPPTPRGPWPDTQPTEAAAQVSSTPVAKAAPGVRWEYAMVVQSTTVSSLGPKEDEKLAICDLLLPGGRKQYKSETALFTALGGKDAEKQKKDGMVYFMILNMLGAEGWELVSDELHERSTAGMTIFDHTTCLKRQVR